MPRHIYYAWYSVSYGSNYGISWSIKIRLCKESLNSDGNQFHIYQQSEHSPLIWTTTTYDVGNPYPGGLGQAYTCGGVKPVNVISDLLRA